MENIFIQHRKARWGCTWVHREERSAYLILSALGSRWGLKQQSTPDLTDGLWKSPLTHCSDTQRESRSGNKGGYSPGQVPTEIRMHCLGAAPASSLWGIVREGLGKTHK